MNKRQFKKALKKETLKIWHFTTDKKNAKKNYDLHRCRKRLVFNYIKNGKARQYIYKFPRSIW